MQQHILRSDTKIEQKIISVSQKDGLLIRPVRVTGGDEFSEQILADLISQGYAGQELLEKFKEYSKAIRPAVLKLLEDNEAFARSGEGGIPIDALFGTEE